MNEVRESRSFTGNRIGDIEQSMNVNEWRVDKVSIDSFVIWDSGEQYWSCKEIMCLGFAESQTVIFC